MRKGEKAILILIVVVVGAAMLYSGMRQQDAGKGATELPFYTTADNKLNAGGMAVYHKYGCKACHKLWTMSDMLQSVPAPALDGIGSLKTRQWLNDYLSAANPQQIVPSRLKPEYRMPSYAAMAAQERDTLVAYLASLKVKDWYLDETRRAECSKLTGGDC
ncbi:MAG: cytochrome c [Gammaproteobacteria bacterium]|nr:cytochrome c [Gammaproteobacteria bacterium]